MIVLDASALIAIALRAPGDQARYLRDRVRFASDVHAPHLIDLEATHTLRRLVRAGTVTDERAREALGDFSLLITSRHQHLDLLDRIWELRHNLSSYDASYVALAERLDVPLVTADARIAAAPGHRATVEVF